MKSRFQPPQTVVVNKKRKTLYSEDEAVEETNKRLAAMDIEDNGQSQ